MPYATNSDLPPGVKDHLPMHAQDIFRAAFNHAWAQYKKSEDTARRVAWAAVKKKYHKPADRWVARDF